MPMAEKELNCHLLDLLDLLDDLQETAEADHAEEATLKLIEKKRKQVNRKLYQRPLLSSEE